MAFTGVFKLTIYLLVLDGLAAVAVTAAGSRPALIGAFVAVLLTWGVDRLRALVTDYRRLWDVLTGVFLVYAVLDLTLLADSFMTAVVHLLLFLEIYKLCNLDSARDVLDLMVLTFLQLLAASTMTVSFAFLPIFCLYMVLSVWGLTLLHLRHEAELALPDRSPAALDASRLIGIRFLLGSGGIAVASLGLALVIFFAIPRIGRTYLPLQATGSSVSTGFSDRVELGTYGSIQRDDSVVMRVSFLDAALPPERVPDLRWRGVAFDRFDGRTWALDNAMRIPARRTRAEAFALGSARPGSPLVSYEVFLEPIGSEVLFVAPRVIAVQGSLPPLARDAADGVVLLGAPASRLRYTVVSQPERWTADQLRQAGSRYPPGIAGTYLQLPPLSARIRRLAEQLTAGATPYDATRRVEAHLARTLRYTLDLTGTPGPDPLEEFLFTDRGGNCEYFAAAMAVLLRAAGIPARVVNGFQRGEWNEVGQYFVVRQRDAHSWVEAYFPNRGWIAFDPTPRAAFESQTFGTSGWARKYLDALRMQWNRYVVDFNVGDQANVALRLRQQSVAARRGLGERLETWSAALTQAIRSHKGLASAALVVPVVLAGVWLLRRRAGLAMPAPGWTWWRRGEPRVVFYQRMLRQLARRGHAAPPTATARELAMAVSARRELYEPVRELTALYERVRFGGEPLARDEESRAAELLRRLAAAPR